MTETPQQARRELPTDPAALEPMGEAFDAAIEAGLTELRLLEATAGSAAARRSYEAHARLLRDWNRAINLTAIREPAEVARRHVCDSLSAVSRLEELIQHGATMLDIGSGGGYPGLPLAAALPLFRVGLLDSVGKKARFLGTAGAAVEAILRDAASEDVTRPRPAIEAIAERAEDFAHDPDQRGARDLVVSRAVGSLAEVVELSLPLAHEGGLVVAWKREERDDLRGELQAAGAIIRAAGGDRPEVVDVATPSRPGHRLVAVSKVRSTPAGYPRPAGTRRRRRR